MEGYLVQNIYWGDTASGLDYLYGSVIHRVGKLVHFENQRFASGKTIKKWLSSTNYQQSRKAPDLPLLKPGATYSIVQKFQVEPEGRAYLQLDFFNRQGEAIGLMILKKDEEVFMFPQDAYTYTISLKSAGCQSVAFSHLALYCKEGRKSFRLPKVGRGYYARERYPEDVEFVKCLIQESRRYGENKCEP
ncbi:TPA: accessory Sec system protein Asp3 [Streptococcus suis]|uniref:accessory Sec system protein Asp3 n=1 Tax=Streptococcus suis TaxID=1307 RepID=UPI0019346E96|nr:accessory Sec system protein Asp3 [Streptococcus suis]MBM0241382.1 accessory Sec system protein Asp3 [Streptococcus suis]MBO3642813.1 accessory Sec system protein Asp3 [Streptococcus suis]MCO8189134.1 accessory Sec system protein Asp3 [Streptococcus suis]MCO8200729.1 accessory Sec system protein Asp3 [Streptococcus suis]MCO8205571.1 accessory Sec system protein Asp3 [Streptococcus suis]